jgi:hypothetical protein
VNLTIEKIIEESIARLISRADNSRGLEASDLRERITKAVALLHRSAAMERRD